MDPRIEAGAKAWDKHMGGRYSPNEVEELSEEVAVILAAADAVGPKRETIETAAGLDRELIVKSGAYLDAFYQPSMSAPFRNVVTGARVMLEELDQRGDFFPVAVIWDPVNEPAV